MTDNYITTNVEAVVMYLKIDVKLAERRFTGQKFGLAKGFSVDVNGAYWRPAHTAAEYLGWPMSKGI
jgi:hypothetical protein